MFDPIDDVMGLEGEAHDENSQKLREIEDSKIISGKDVAGSEAPDHIQEVVDDYTLAREVIIFTIEEAQRALKQARKDHITTGSPEQGKVIVNLLKIIGENSSKLTYLHDTVTRRAQRETPQQKPEDPQKLTNKNNNSVVLLGTTQDVLEALESQKKSKDVMAG